jgi:hypothetical protein
MHRALYIGVWCECFFLLHISYPNNQKIFPFEISLCILPWNLVYMCGHDYGDFFFIEMITSTNSNWHIRICFSLHFFLALLTIHSVVTVP